ncbi:MAG: DUF4358 domain-containing protein [Lachnospiraceae bacterium]|nr:DUF4358 domain-containing protein [Lachnospiraceae bacterium]
MKKKAIVCGIATAMVLAMTACTNGDAPAVDPTPAPTEAAATTDGGSTTDTEQGGETAQAEDLSPQEIYDQIAAKYTLPDLYLGDDDWILNNYGLDASKLDGYVCGEGDEIHADRVFIVKVKDAADVADVKAKLDSVLGQLSSQQMLDYLPEQADIIKAASVKTKGNYVTLFLSADAAGMEEIFNAAVH